MKEISDILHFVLSDFCKFLGFFFISILYLGIVAIPVNAIVTICKVYFNYRTIKEKGYPPQPSDKK